MPPRSQDDVPALPSSSTRLVQSSSFLLRPCCPSAESRIDCSNCVVRCASSELRCGSVCCTSTFSVVEGGMNRRVPVPACEVGGAKWGGRDQPATRSAAALAFEPLASLSTTHACDFSFFSHPAPACLQLATGLRTAGAVRPLHPPRRRPSGEWPSLSPAVEGDGLADWIHSWVQPL